MATCSCSEDALPSMSDSEFGYLTPLPEDYLSQVSCARLVDNHRQSIDQTILSNEDSKNERSEKQFQASEEATSDATFQHPPLADPKNEIRLLELEAGTGDAEIRCKLRVCNRAASPSYEAIRSVHPRRARIRDTC